MLFAHRQIKCPIVFNIVKVLKSKIPIKADGTIIVVILMITFNEILNHNNVEIVK